jgi:hypothetical protein
MTAAGSLTRIAPLRMPCAGIHTWADHDESYIYGCELVSAYAAGRDFGPGLNHLGKL